MHSTTSTTSLGKVALYYSGNCDGEKVLPDVVIQKKALLTNDETGEVRLYFNLFYPGLPMEGNVSFTLQGFQSNVIDLYIYKVQAIGISREEFLLIIHLFWEKENDTENFELMGRFKGTVPKDIPYRYCPGIVG